MPNYIINIDSKEDDLLIDEAEILCYIVNSELEPSYLKSTVAGLLAKQKIVLLGGAKSVSLLQELKADGVLIDFSNSNNIRQDIQTIRSQIGKSILGAICRGRRHEAMLVSENELDFVVFKIWPDGKMHELVSWYNEFFLLQMAVLPPQGEGGFEDYPADMVILTPQDYKIFVAKK